MRVAVLGSWRHEDKKRWSLRETPEAFQAACRQVGLELIRRGHSLIVGSDSDHTADGNAVRGAIEAFSGTTPTVESPRIMLIRPRSSAQGLSFPQLRRSIPGVFVERQVDSQSWAVVKLVQTQLADAVILIGGAEKTEQAGLTAAVSKKPLACIGSFGGAAAALNARFVDSPTTWGYEPRQTRRFPELQEPFSDVVLKSALEAAWIEGAPKLMIIHGRSPDRDLFKQYLLKHVGRVVVLADEFASTEPIPLKFERFASSVDGAIALLTPDDIGGLASDRAIAAPRARENVWVEVGWFWGHRSRSKLLLLRKGAVTIPSDLGNVENYEYVSGPEDPEVEPKIQQFIAKLRSASEAEAFHG
jgi:Predicted nucleotide-binding protein containing TIR-like domain